MRDRNPVTLVAPTAAQVVELARRIRQHPVVPVSSVVDRGLELQGQAVERNADD
jgi:hypothetical protein